MYVILQYRMSIEPFVTTTSSAPNWFSWKSVYLQKKIDKSHYVPYLWENCRYHWKRYTHIVLIYQFKFIQLVIFPIFSWYNHLFLSLTLLIQLPTKIFLITNTPLLKNVLMYYHMLLNDQNNNNGKFLTL